MLDVANSGPEPDGEILRAILHGAAAGACCARPIPAWQSRAVVNNATAKGRTFMRGSEARGRKDVREGMRGACPR